MKTDTNGAISGGDVRGDDASLPDALRRLLDQELSTRSRLAYVGLLLIALAAGVALASLWITEPSLPTRTQIAFAVMLAIALSWCVFAIWALRNRRVLYARHRVVSARMATLFCLVFSAGAFALALIGDVGSAYLAGLLGLLMTAVALTLLIRAHRHHDDLRLRRSELERRLARHD